MDIAKKYVKPKEFAEITGLCLQSVYNMKRDGKLPIFQVSPRRYLIDLEEYFRQNKKD